MSPSPPCRIPLSHVEIFANLTLSALQQVRLAELMTGVSSRTSTACQQQPRKNSHPDSPAHKINWEKGNCSAGEAFYSEAFNFYRGNSSICKWIGKRYNNHGSKESFWSRGVLHWLIKNKSLKQKDTKLCSFLWNCNVFFQYMLIKCINSVNYLKDYQEKPDTTALGWQ